MSSTVDLEAAGIDHPAMDVTSSRRVDGDDFSDGSLSSESDGEYDYSSSVQHIAAQLAAAGAVGVAAAAAITSGKKRKRPYSFEMNPSIRKRQQTRILRKLKATMEEYTRRIGQQAVVLLCTPGKPHNCYKVFGAKPLEDVVRNCKSLVMQELENALAQQTPMANQEDPSLHELPPLVIDGIPTPVEKMSQAQLRGFIPLMLKYATGRGKPGWGKESTRPPWWPEDLPWANVRSDVRPENEKHKVSWTHALRQIVINCYRYYRRDDLLPSFKEGEDGHNDNEEKEKPPVQNLVRAVLKTIQHTDGTLSLVQLHPNGTVITLGDVQTGIQTLQNAQHATATHAVQTLADAATQESHDGAGRENVHTVATLTQAAVDRDGQIILTTENGQQAIEAYPVSGMVTIPLSMYQTVVANVAQPVTEQTNSSGNMQIVMTQTEQQQQQQPQLITVATVQLPNHEQAS